MILLVFYMALCSFQCVQRYSNGLQYADMEQDASIVSLWFTFALFRGTVLHGKDHWASGKNSSLAKCNRLTVETHGTAIWRFPEMGSTQSSSIYRSDFPWNKLKPSSYWGSSMEPSISVAFHFDPHLDLQECSRNDRRQPSWRSAVASGWKAWTIWQIQIRKSNQINTSINE